jgi:YidC/Oxa1 family membrane protein insertase
MQSFQTPNPDTQADLRRLMLAMVFMIGALWLWEYLYPTPQVETPQQAVTQSTLNPVEAAAEVEQQRDEAIANAGTRLPIESPVLHGSLALKGARFDDVVLAKYRETLDKSSPEITLLSPAATAQSYFAEFGWLAANGVKVPDSNTVWNSTSTAIRPNERVVLWWENGEGLRFERRITLDSHYMFTIEQVVINQGGNAVQLTPFGRIQRRFDDAHLQHYMISHEGPVGVLNNELHEVAYKDLREGGAQRFESTGGWVGFGDKYWLSAAVFDANQRVQTQLSVVSKLQEPIARYQADYTAAAMLLSPGQNLVSTVRFFAGAKEVAVLDSYAAAGVPLFDRAVDFGVLYFLTKPIFKLLAFFHSLLGNFGLAILLLTVVIKAFMFPLANKSFRAMNQMKRLQPEMEKLKTRHGEDRVRFQQELMALYKREKVNPASGCLPILIQIPVFFALYKVLFVSIEMRHAPFFGWIHDLSAPDPSNLFTLFGLIPWHTPSFLHLGLWPIIFCLTMIVQQKFSPKPSDPVQAKVMGFLPFIFLFLFSGFPAGLVIYWSWSNMLTILQQWVITRQLPKDGTPVAISTEPKKGKAKPAAANNR